MIFIVKQISYKMNTKILLNRFESYNYYKI